jgi:hypothetical protein
MGIHSTAVDSSSRSPTSETAAITKSKATCFFPDFAERAFDEGLVSVEKPARKPPLATLEEVGRPAHEEQGAVPLDDRVHHDVAQRGRRPILEAAGDHVIHDTPAV